MSKDTIEDVIKFYMSISPMSPHDFRVEECEKDRVVLSFKYTCADSYSYSYGSNDRVYKEFVLANGEVTSVNSFIVK